MFPGRPAHGRRRRSATTVSCICILGTASPASAWHQQRSDGAVQGCARKFAHQFRHARGVQLHAMVFRSVRVHRQRWPALFIFWRQRANQLARHPARLQSHQRQRLGVSAVRHEFFRGEPYAQARRGLLSHIFHDAVCRHGDLL